MKKIVTVFAILFATSLPAFAQMSGAEIMKKSDEMASSDNEQSVLVMRLINSKGKERSRNIKQFIRFDENDNRSSLIRFNAPADVAGTGFLAVENADREDDQYLYLPALQRSRRISASNETDNFMGSDFTFEDLDREDLSDFNYKLEGEEQINGAAAWKIIATPANDKKAKESGYSKREIFVSKQSFIPLMINYYDKKGTLTKVFTAKDVKEVGAGKYRAHKMEIANKATGHTTVLEFSDFVINGGLEEDFFTVRYLEKTN